MAADHVGQRNPLRCARADLGGEALGLVLEEQRSVARDIQVSTPWLGM